MAAWRLRGPVLRGFQMGLWVVLTSGCSGAIDGSPVAGPDKSGLPGGAAKPGGGAGDGTGPAAGAPGDRASGSGDPGRVTLHRLNRVEYTNTVRDLLGTTLRPADDFPADDRGYGYDNIADVLSLSPVQIEMYFNAASVLIDEAMAVVAVGARRFEAEAMEGTTGSVYQASAWGLFSPGSVQQTTTIQTAGEYRLAVRAWADQAGPEPARVSLDVNAAALATFDVTAVASSPEVYETMVQLEAGSAILAATFTNDFYDAATSADRNVYVDWVEIEGPLGVKSDNPQRARIMRCEPAASDPKPCLREIAADFGSRAFRRSLSTPEVDALVSLATSAIAAGDDIESATRLLLRATLVSPEFIFRVETDADPIDPAPHALTDHELASRLSYFLWSSMPDAVLLAAANAGELGDDAALKAQVKRMLDDPKADALLHNFAGQWLFIRALDDHDPDYQVFPNFDEPLRAAMRTEMELYLREFIFGDESMNNLLTADFSFVNERLAKHYGMPAPAIGEGFVRTALGASQRAGLLTQAGVLMVTSYATRTSPVKRGKWVLEQLLCSPPPPPPPGVEGLVKEAVPSGSLRQRMEAHRTNPVCASCHTQMDPIGFSFEHYDAIGALRDTDQGFAIDPSGMLPDGTTFSGPLELAPLLSADERLPRCMAQQLFTYALGRGPEAYDDPAIDGIRDAFVAGGYLFPELIEAIVLSDSFRMRRGEPQEKAP